MVNSKNAFWQALVFTVIIFILGLILGFFLETYRGTGVENNLMNSEVNLLDEQFKEKASDIFPVSCESKKQSLFDFADRIYLESQQLEQYTTASKFSKENLGILHRRYDILRSILWVESINLKQNCSSDFHTVVYLYTYDTQDLTQKAEQTSVSRVLLDLKSQYPKNILLIPIATNLNLSSVNLITESYNLTSYPTVIIDEKKIVSGLTTQNEIKNIVFSI